MTASVFNIRELALNDEQVGSLNEMAAKRSEKARSPRPPETRRSASWSSP